MSDQVLHLVGHRSVRAAVGVAVGVYFGNIFIGVGVVVVVVVVGIGMRRMRTKNRKRVGSFLVRGEKSDQTFSKKIKRLSPSHK